MARQAEINRKIHLDFHTPHWTKQVGQDYDPEDLVRIWKKARINAVTVVFGLCACGNAYYDSKIAPVHPSLQRDLLRPLLPVAKREGIKIYIHFGPGINDRSVIEHPEWAMQMKDGSKLDTQGGTQWGWPCYNSPYITEWFWPQLTEFVKLFPEVEGIFIDMVVYPEQTCYCSYCQAKAVESGLDLRNPNHMDQVLNNALNHFIAKSREIVKKANPNMGFTCNCRNFIGGVRDENLDFLELEAPITWNSYYYPIMSRHIRTLDKPSCGMTTRFPKNWGYFGSLNNDTQLKFECASILATLGSCCIGDQLHPSGKPDVGVYELIGDVYKFVEEREPWVLGAKSVPYLAIFADQQRDLGAREYNSSYYTPHQTPAALYGAGLILLEGNRHFDVLDEMNDFSQHKLVWLPENVTFDPSLAEKLEAYVAKGGRVLVTGNTLWQIREWREVLEKLAHVNYNGLGELAGEFIQPMPDFSSNLPQIPYYVKGRFPRWEAKSQTKIAAKVYRPYEEISSDRKFGHFHAPVGDEAPYSGAVVHSYGKGKVAVIAASLAEDYFTIGSKHTRQLVLNILDSILDTEDRLVEVEAGSPSVEISLMSQNNRWILHLIQYNAKRNTGNTVIEEIPLRHNIPVSLRPPAAPKRISLAPSGDELSWTSQAGAVKFNVPMLHIHQMIVVEF